MKKFALVLQPDDWLRLARRHPLIRYLPERVLEKYLTYFPIKCSGMIVDKKHNVDLGFLMEVPAFFDNWQKAGEKARLKTLKGIIRSLKKREAEVLCFPLIHQYLRDDETLYLRNKGIVLLDGFFHRMAGLLLAADKIFTILAAEIPGFEAGIWGADTGIGRIWAEYLAYRVNFMCIGGRDLRKLEHLADNILKNAGLACNITVKPEDCLNNKNIAVSARPIDPAYTKANPSFYFPVYERVKYSHGRDDIDENRKQKNYIIELGWMTLPRELELPEKLSPWDELAALDGALYISSKAYREKLLNSRLTSDLIKQLHALYNLYNIKLQGFINQGRRVSFDRFRREYFRDRQKIVKIL